jgi:UDP-N-acetylglucosamine 2-epimerase (non-hydrolysing)
LNPNIHAPAHRLLKNVTNIHLIPPPDYPQPVQLLARAFIVLTDSGGIQEEAPALGKPVPVLRNVTERIEGVAAGTAKLTGTDPAAIFADVSLLLNDTPAYQQMAKAINPYGDGKSVAGVAAVIDRYFSEK